ncbi:calcium-binding protein, partial [Pseudorhodobacter sp.]|uniref:calcium-binding protein n=1 Tax=Pseudorhodobacter sp. TaxID=1934400 RepID=UPI0039E566EB
GDAGFVLGAADTITGGDGDDLIYINAWGAEAGQTIIDPVVITDFSATDALEIHIDRMSDLTNLSLAPTEDGTGTEILVDGVTHAILQGATAVDLTQITLSAETIAPGRYDGTEGDDTIISGGGDVYMSGRGGNDLLSANVAGAGNATIEGGLGNDTIIGGPLGDWLYGGLGDDVIESHSSGDQASGDFISGGFGDDTILGGHLDFIIGGDGSDEIQLDAAHGPVTLLDFVPGVDVIALTDASGGPAADFSLREVEPGVELLYAGNVIALVVTVETAAFDLTRDVRLTLG